MMYSVHVYRLMCRPAGKTQLPVCLCLFLLPGYLQQDTDLNNKWTKKHSTVYTISCWLNHWTFGNTTCLHFLYSVSSLYILDLLPDVVCQLINIIFMIVFHSLPREELWEMWSCCSFPNLTQFSINPWHLVKPYVLGLTSSSCLIFLNVNYLKNNSSAH